MFLEIRPDEMVDLKDEIIEPLTYLMELCTDWESLYSKKAPKNVPSELSIILMSKLNDAALLFSYSFFLAF